ncbi:MAG TPA: hypothetical protein VJU18_19535 [Vicinamibacteria bacterium]|nr:hypothetical protein [Vicinamibacteria bacterium]
MHKTIRAGLGVAACLLLAFGSVPTWGQNRDADRDRGVDMLRNIKIEIARLYHDPRFGGLDLDAHFRAAEERLRQAASEAQISRILAQAVLDFGDSHTSFIPPPFPYDVEYGFDMKMVGDACRVVAVKPGSDAAAKDLKPGSAIRLIEGVVPTRKTMAQISPEDLEAGRDAVLARAASLLDAKLDPEKAGTLFPRDWSRR